MDKAEIHQRFEAMRKKAAERPPPEPLSYRDLLTKISTMFGFHGIEHVIDEQLQLPGCAYTQEEQAFLSEVKSTTDLDVLQMKVHMQLGNTEKAAELAQWIQDRPAREAARLGGDDL